MSKKVTVRGVKDQKRRLALEAMLNKPDFLAEVKKGMEDADAGRWVWDEDLDKR